MNDPRAEPCVDGPSAPGVGLSAETLSFKGRMLMTAVLELPETGFDAIQRAVGARVREAPEWFASVPVVVDVAKWANLNADRVRRLRAVLESCGLRVLGVCESAAVDDAVDRADWPLAVVPLNRTDAESREARLGEPREAGGVAHRAASSGGAPRGRPPSRAAADYGVASPRSATSPTLVVYQPVRSGQQVYARGGDLIVFGSVSDGAEILADGHIHVHGSLRGRALAGVQGDVSAVLYARQFEPQLVSIAGHYRTAEDLDRDRGPDRLVRLDGEALRVVSLERG